MRQCTDGPELLLGEGQVKSSEIQAVEGRKISLPCPLSAPSRDKVYMVLWFKDDAGIPLYRRVGTNNKDRIRSYRRLLALELAHIITIFIAGSPSPSAPALIITEWNRPEDKLLLQPESIFVTSTANATVSSSSSSSNSSTITTTTCSPP
uniref:Ig-like domain-containing protein n=1 Tax=Anopheles albimanus TaxID=7167 RepID=A0A182FWJ8_ANOAL